MTIGESFELAIVGGAGRDEGYGCQNCRAKSAMKVAIEVRCMLL